MKQDSKRQSGKIAHENFALTDAITLLNSAKCSNYQIIKKTFLQIHLGAVR